MAFDLFHNDGTHFAFVSRDGHCIAKALQKFDLLISYCWHNSFVKSKYP